MNPLASVALVFRRHTYKPVRERKEKSDREEIGREKGEKEEKGERKVRERREKEIHVQKEQENLQQ